MSHVIANIAKDATAEYGGCSVPVVKEDCMCKFPERCRKNQEERWRHDQSKLVHREIVMHSVEREM